MSRWCVRVAGAVIGLVVACHHGAPPAAPVPTPPGDPPRVQAPVGSAPILDAAAPQSSPNTPDPRLRRFEVVAVDETTFTILIGADRWVRRGTQGVAVDPKRRDALVARFRILGRVGDSATALVTGQTTRVDPTHVALMREPVAGPLRQKAFWAGIVLGVAAGAAAILLVRP